MLTPRAAGPHDIPALVRVINLAYRVEDFFVNGNRTDNADIASRMARPGAVFLALDAPVPGEIAAAVYFEIHGTRGYFAMLSVDPASQKRGLARALISEMEARCRRAGCAALDIEVVDLREELPAFYRRLGFSPTGTAPFPDPGKLLQPAHLVLMSKPL